MSQISEPTLNCGRHSQIPATQYCAQCAMPLCDSCARPQMDRTIKCPVCSVASKGVPEALRPRIPTGVPLVSQPCAQHPEVKTMRRCGGCTAPVCDTCDFTQPGNVHICPTCAMNAPTGLSSSRKKLLIAGYLLAIWSTVGMTLLLTGFFADETISEAALGIVLSVMVFLPALIGFAVSSCAQERRLHNPLSVWIAVVWNSLLMLGFIALTAVGLMMG
jgi:hypothetical protein